MNSSRASSDFRVPERGDIVVRIGEIVGIAVGVGVFAILIYPLALHLFES
jgi:hypothetical protein